MIVVVCPQNAVGIAVGVIELTTPQHPEEPGQPKPAQKQADRNQIGQVFQAAYLTRQAFRLTVIDETDIAKAAIRGVAMPIRANGTAIRL